MTWFSKASGYLSHLHTLLDTSEFSVNLKTSHEISNLKHTITPKSYLNRLLTLFCEAFSFSFAFNGKKQTKILKQTYSSHINKMFARYTELLLRFLPRLQALAGHCQCPPYYTGNKQVVPRQFRPMVILCDHFDGAILYQTIEDYKFKLRHPRPYSSPV